MTHHWDEFSKSLAEESLPRRESLRRLGILFAGAVLSPLGVGTAWARGPDPCKTFCRCRNASQQKACLAACNACDKDTSRLAGSCGSYTCCAAGQTNCGPYWAQLGTDTHCGFCADDCTSYGKTCCNYYCVNLADNFDNCGGCSNACDAPDRFERAACIDGRCEYWCVEGAVVCDGGCSLLDRDPINCGACGNVCPESAPYCVQGECKRCPESGQAVCGGSCAYLGSDRFNCGACGSVCAPDMICDNGVCTECAPGLTFCGDQNSRYAYCADLLWDQNNCGACGKYCDPYYEYCSDGYCYGYYGGGDYGY